MCRNGKAIDLSVDHKAKRKDEQDRIKSNGGYIVYGRVLGRLAISRAFGDFDCKNIEMPPKNLDGTENTNTNRYNSAVTLRWHSHLSISAISERSVFQNTLRRKDLNLL